MSWFRRRRLSSQIATPAIEALYERALSAGAVGGKLLGAGGGGFLLLYVEPDRRLQVLRALPELREVAFEFESDGSALMLNRPAEQPLGVASRPDASMRVPVS